MLAKEYFFENLKDKYHFLITTEGNYEIRLTLISSFHCIASQIQISHDRIMLIAI